MVGTVAVLVGEDTAARIDGRGVMAEVSSVPIAVLNIRLVEIGVGDVEYLELSEMYM